MIEVIENQERVAWSSQWVSEEHDKHQLVATTRLRLSQEISFRLISRMPYDAAFKNATLRVPGLPEAPFVVIHASFGLFRDGEAEIRDFAVVLSTQGLQLHPRGVLINLTAKLLRGLHGQGNL